MTKEHLLERWRDHTYLHPRTYERACREAMQWVIDNGPYALDRLTRNRFPDHATRLESVELEGHYPKAWLVLTFLHEASGVRATKREDLWLWSYWDGDANTATILLNPSSLVSLVIANLTSDLPGIMREAGAPVD